MYTVRALQSVKHKWGIFLMVLGSEGSLAWLSSRTDTNTVARVRVAAWPSLVCPKAV